MSIDEDKFKIPEWIIHAALTIMFGLYGYHQYQIEKLNDEMQKIQMEYATKEELRLYKQETLNTIELKMQTVVQRIDMTMDYMRLLIEQSKVKGDSLSGREK